MMGGILSEHKKSESPTLKQPHNSLIAGVAELAYDMNPYGDYKVYGPYRRKDGRQHVVIYSHEDNIRITVSYPRYLLEIHLGQKLDVFHDVHHINGDFSDNRIENLEIIHCIPHRVMHGKGPRSPIGRDKKLKISTGVGSNPTGGTT